MHDENCGSALISDTSGTSKDLARNCSASKITEDRIGFIGLGRMGRAMAGNLAGAGCKVTAFYRRSEHAQDLANLGLEPSNDIEELFDCDFLITMLPDDAAVREVVFGSASQFGLDGLVSGLASDAVHISMSTISPSASMQFAEAHRKFDQGYVAAPVFGNPDAAKARELYVIAGGASDQLQRCQPIFDLLGQRTFLIGSEPASANLVKLAGNMMTATTLEMLGEVMALIRKRGLDPNQFLDVLTSTMFGSRVHKIYGAKIAAQDYPESGFAFPLALKDVRLALAEGEAANVPMPSVAVVRDRLITGIARGYGKLDWSALGLMAAEEAGLARRAGTGSG